MAKKRTKAGKKKANQKRVKVGIGNEGQYSYQGSSSSEFDLVKKSVKAASFKSKSRSKSPKGKIVKSRSKIMESIDVSQIKKDLGKTLLVTSVILVVLLAILNYF